MATNAAPKTSLTFSVRTVTSDGKRQPKGETREVMSYDQLKNRLIALNAISDRYTTSHDDVRSHWTFRGGLDPFTDVYISPATEVPA